MEAAQVEIERRRATAIEQAVALHLHAGKSTLGLTTGAVPARVNAGVKARLLALVCRYAAARGCGRRCCHPAAACRGRRRRNQREVTTPQ